MLEYVSTGLGKPGLFFTNTDSMSRGTSEKINIVIDKDTNNVMLLAMDENLEKRVSDLFKPAIKINEGCPVWNFVISV